MEKVKRIYKHRPYQAVANLSKVTNEQKNKVIKLYIQGSSQTHIEETLKMTRKTIRTILKNQGVDRDKSTQWRISRGSSLNETVFDILTPEALYWIGFLYADGHIRKEKEFSIELEIELKDISHLEKYKKFFNCNKEIKIFDNSCKLKLYSKVLHQKLKDLGFTNRKSWDAIPHILLKNSRDFWRGVIDGDGSLSNQHEGAFIHLCGTKETTDEFIFFLKRNGFETEAESRRCLKGHVLHQVSWGFKKARFVANLLYKDSEVYLERKYQKYITWITKNNIVQ